MARLESIAVAGYYPFPPHLILDVADLVTVPETVIALDPCAGEGCAIFGLLQIWGSRRATGSEVLAIEMEPSRFKSLQEKPWAVKPKTLLGDAFLAEVALKSSYGSDYRGVNLLYLNPPYAYDLEFLRLEEKFLHRFTPALAKGGVLIFVIPQSALTASADTLALHYSNLHCYKLPEKDFAAYKQVVLVAEKDTKLEVDRELRDLILSWATSNTLPELGSEKKVVTVKEEEPEYYSITMGKLDLTDLVAKIRPWFNDKGPLDGVYPEVPEGFLARTYPVAMPPKPAHLAAGIAAGIFNGHKVEPDSGIGPSLLVKGVFDRDYVTTEVKTNKEGDTLGEVQEQRPKLVVTVLDLTSGKFHTLTSSVEVTGSTKASEMTTADLFTQYGKSLMRVMREQCPVLYDPSKNSVTVPEGIGRPLYLAQAHAANAAVGLLGGQGCRLATRRGKAALVLGELGSGKTSIALSVLAQIKAKKTFIMCPPHLLDSWRDEVSKVLPGMRVQVLDSVTAIDSYLGHTGAPVIGLMSRESAKLGHSWEGVGDYCPKCGEPTPEGDLAKHRSRCQVSKHVAGDLFTKASIPLALCLKDALPESSLIGSVLRTPFLQRALASRSNSKTSTWNRDRFSELVLKLIKEADLSKTTEGHIKALFFAAFSTGDLGVIESFARKLLSAQALSSLGVSNWVQLGILLLEEDSYQELLEVIQDKVSYYSTNPLVSSRESLLKEESPGYYDYSNLNFKEGKLFFKTLGFGSLEAAKEAVSLVASAGVWTKEAECGEFLYQAVPTPRRVPLATYLSRRANKGKVDFLIFDEAHELSGGANESAQSICAHRLTNLRIPTLMLTGSVMNGYADSLFTNQWALDPQFRKDFSRSQRADFVKRYGYTKRLLKEADSKDKTKASYGSQSDRRLDSSAKVIGHTPGVLPLFLLKYLLRISVVIHQSDLALDLPPKYETVEYIQPHPSQKQAFDRLKTALVEQIKKDRFGPDAGKLMGMMAELPSYLDLAVVGNAPEGVYKISYPNGDLVAQEPSLGLETLPKEDWMLSKAQSELDEGRNVMVLSWHTSLLTRYQKLLSKLSPCAILDAKKVPASKRQEWINKEVISKGRRILVVNPVSIQTGLNNLVHFHTQLWMENPACKPITYRQATGRVARISQTKEARIIFPVYSGTLQEHMHKLLLHKVAVSQATDGLDAESAFQAAGVGEVEGYSSLSIGRQLYDLALATG